jgi:hypothetical protein
MGPKDEPIYFNMKICAVSSLSFLGAAIATRQVPLYVLWVASTLHHSGYPCKWIFIIDKSLAHTICIWSMLKIRHNLIVYWSCWAWAVGVYKVFGLSQLPSPRGDYWHATLHVMTSVGMVAAHLEPVNWFQFLSLFGVVFVGLKLNSSKVV